MVLNIREIRMFVWKVNGIFVIPFNKNKFVPLNERKITDYRGLIKEEKSLTYCVTLQIKLQ